MNNGTLPSWKTKPCNLRKNQQFKAYENVIHMFPFPCIAFFFIIKTFFNILSQNAFLKLKSFCSDLEI